MILFITLFLLSFTLYLLGGVYYFKSKSLITDVYAHVAFPGVVLAYILFHSLDLYLVVFVTSVFVLIVDYLKAKLLSITNFSTDSIFAFFIAFGFSIGTLFVNFLQNRGVSTKAGFSDFLFGNLSSLNQSDSYVIIFFSLITLFWIFFYRKVLLSYLFDEFSINKIGFNLLYIERSLSLMAVVLTVLSLKVAGVVLTTGLFLIPFSISILFFNKIKHLIKFSIILISFVSFISIIISLNYSGMSTGPILIFIYFLVFLLSLLGKKIFNKLNYG